MRDLTQEDLNIINQAMMNPPAPNARLIQAKENYTRMSKEMSLRKRPRLKYKKVNFDE